LDPERTSPYRFFQYWLNTDDQDAIQYLKYFTLLPWKEVADLESELVAKPHQRAAQKRLAEEVTRSLHGQTGLDRAKRATEVFFGGTLDGLEGGEIADVFADVPSSELSRESLGGEGMPVQELLANSGVATSKGDARRSIQGGGVYLNNVRIGDEEMRVGSADTLDGGFIVLRKGKKNYHLVKVVG
jgi:tyrosyl-tRNA synthetase